MDDAEEPPSGEQPPPTGGTPNVSLADAAIAAAIGRAAAQGRGPDRAPTLEQLLAAFGEGEATTDARARVGAALSLAGVAVEPELRTAAPGQRLTLSTPGMTPANSRSRVFTAIYALGALALILGTAYGVRQAIGSDDDRVPVLTKTTLTISSVPTTTTATTTTPTTGTATATTVGTTTATTTATETTETTTAAERAAKKRAEEKRRRERAAAKKNVVVRVEAPTGGTFLCVDDGEGNSLFNATLEGKRTFKAKRVLLNIGLATTRVTVNGKAIPLSGSPTGLDVTPKAVKPLPLGSRPCA